MILVRFHFVLKNLRDYKIHHLLDRILLIILIYDYFIGGIYDLKNNFYRKELGRPMDLWFIPRNIYLRSFFWGRYSFLIIYFCSLCVFYLQMTFYYFIYYK